MRRLLAVLAVLATLAVTSPLLPGSAAQGATAPPPVKHATRQYGQGPVFVERNQVLRLRFRGEKGDRVQLNSVIHGESGVYYGRFSDGQSQLLDASGRPTRISQDLMGFFRLPGSGWFTLRFKAGNYDGAGGPVQLVLQDRVRFHAGDTLTLPQRRGYQYVVRVRAPKDGFDLVSLGHHWGIQSRGSLSGSGIGKSILIGPGFPVVDGESWVAKTKPLEAGEPVLVLMDPSVSAVVQSHPVQPVVLELDGEPAPAAGALTTVAATFTGGNGQLVHLDHGQGGTHAIALFGPGHRVRDSIRGRGDVYELTTVGTYTAVPIPLGDAPDSEGLRARSLLDVGEVEVDGPPLDVDAQPDGRLVFGHIAQPSTQGLFYGAVTADTLSSDRWRLFAGVFHLNCPPRGPLGCGDYSYTVLSRLQPVTQEGFYGDFFVADTDSSTSGSLSLSFTSTPPT